MKLTIDTDEKTLVCEGAAGREELPLYSDRAFEVISEQWVKVGWNQRYAYTFSWMGRPIIQLPEDLLRVQEVIYRVKPDVLIETGVAHGGSLIFYASLFKAMGKGRVVGIDVEIRANNREALEAHELFPFIDLIEGSSVAADTISKVKALIRPGETVMVILDSCHTKGHVTRELEAYHDLVTPGSYIVATDGIMEGLHDAPRGESTWVWDHPSASAAEFVAQHPEYALEQPSWPFNESTLKENITHWPGAYLRRK